MPNAKPTTRTFVATDNGFALDGKPYQIISGEMHYPRVPNEYWRDRMQKAKAMGLNTICTYAFWNIHEPKPGKFDFAGNADIAEFANIAQQEGLWVIVRPGPYICSEWEFGGYPAWLLKDPNVVVRSLDPKFTRYVERYMAKLGEQLKPMMLSQGGPIIMAQVENEYGSYGHDHAYMAWSEKVMKDSGFDCQLYTSDGASNSMLSGGTLPNLPATINFGGDAKGQFENLAKFRAEGPRMNAEFWCGWFDHWGSKHSTTSVKEHTNDLKWMLSQGYSVNFYMFHGGTNPGFMAGANWDEGYEPDTTSYDYDAPLNEAGEPTAKFESFRTAIQEHMGAALPDLPKPLPKISIPSFELKPFADLRQAVVRAAKSEKPKAMEEMDQAYGYILYQKKVGPFSGELRIENLADYALILADGKPLGELSRMGQTALPVDIKKETKIEIIVHNLGRINFGHKLATERKGILGGVYLGDNELLGWESCSIPCESLKQIKRTGTTAIDAPAFYRGSFELEAVGGTFLDMSGWGIGAVWINGRNVGRYWHIGAQQALFVPGIWLKKGRNEIVVLDLLDRTKRYIKGVQDPIWLKV